MHAYLASCDPPDDILCYWRNKSAAWPFLASLARTVLAIPAAKTSSERVFSVAGKQIEERRTQLSADSVENLLFIHGLKTQH